MGLTPLNRKEQFSRKERWKNQHRCSSNAFTLNRRSTVWSAQTQHQLENHNGSPSNFPNGGEGELSVHYPAGHPPGTGLV